MSTREEIETLGFEVPDLIEPVVAYRSWLIVGMGGKPNLCSHNIRAHWIPGQPLKAECHTSRHIFFDPTRTEIPIGRCSCGIYAAKKSKANTIVPNGQVYGEVYLWGKIFEGPRGYRAEYCYPKQFFVTDQAIKDIVKTMGFGVPITLVRSPYSRFPFPVTIRQRVNHLAWSFSAMPALGVGILDALTLDLSKVWNCILTAGMLLLGIAASALSILGQRILRKMRSV